MTPTSRQTAKNNLLIRKVRRVMNEPIAKQFTRVYNSDGELAAIDFLSGHFGSSDKVLATIDATYEALVATNGEKWPR